MTMNKFSNLLIVGMNAFCFLIFISCDSNETTKKKDQRVRDSIEAVRHDSIERTIKDSLEHKLLIEKENQKNDSLSKIVIGEMLFGISETEFQETKNNFLYSCNYHLDEYNFKELFGFFHEESLYKIVIVGEELYTHYAEEQYSSLQELFKIKFGNPTGLNKQHGINEMAGIQGNKILTINELITSATGKYPNHEDYHAESDGYRIVNGDKISLGPGVHFDEDMKLVQNEYPSGGAQWKIGSKTIEIFIVRRQYKNFIILSISLPNIEQKIQERVKEKEKQKREDEIKRAVEKL